MVDGNIDFDLIRNLTIPPSKSHFRSPLHYPPLTVGEDFCLYMVYYYGWWDHWHWLSSESSDSAIKKSFSITPPLSSPSRRGGFLFIYGILLWLMGIFDAILRQKLTSVVFFVIDSIRSKLHSLNLKKRRALLVIASLAAVLTGLWGCRNNWYIYFQRYFGFAFGSRLPQRP